MAIQQYLREEGGFTYSLTLAPPVRDRSGKGAVLDSLTSFLVTKQGYCVQFATAMVMMSRAAGIPARLAIGFLPGTQNRGVWNVVTADAHTWPQLYLGGIGWTRFEPTPARAVPPTYALPVTSPGTGSDGQSLGTAAAPAPGNATPKNLADPNAANGNGTVVGLSSTSVLRWLTRGWGMVLLGSLLVLFGLLVVPGAARWRRRRSLTDARTVAARVEVEWELLTSSLGDLGIAPVPSRTPRQLRGYYDREALLEGPASQALGRVVATLERTRYAAVPHTADSISMGAESFSMDARRVLRAATETRAGRNRLRAALWPSTGILQLRSARGSLGRRIRLGEDTLRQWLRRARGDKPTAWRSNPRHGDA